VTDLPFYLIAFAVVLGVLIIVHELALFRCALVWCQGAAFFDGSACPVAEKMGRDATEWA
jgi:regulator of sigma E protease